MNWTEIETDWHRMKVYTKESFTRLTDEDLRAVSGQRDRLVRKVQQRYGVVREDAEKQVEEWIDIIPSLQVQIESD